MSRAWMLCNKLNNPIQTPQERCLCILFIISLPIRVIPQNGCKTCMPHMSLMSPISSVPLFVVPVFAKCFQIDEIGVKVEYKNLEGVGIWNWNVCGVDLDKRLKWMHLKWLSATATAQRRTNWWLCCFGRESKYKPFILCYSITCSSGV